MITILDHEHLKKIGMYELFAYHMKDYALIFSGSDLGEVYAIALALALGCFCLVTDDIKERGPHYTLMRIPDSVVMPLTFYEIMFIDFLEGKITKESLLGYFTQIYQI